MKKHSVAPRPQPGAIISPRLYVFDKDVSLSQNILLSQGRYALQEMLAAIGRMYRLINEPPHIDGVYLHRDIPATITEICFHSGIASNLLFNGSPKGRESDTAYKSRVERHEYVRQLLADHNVKINVLADKAVRNKLQHVDQFLPTLLADEKVGWCIDVALEGRNAPFSKSHLKFKFIRTFVVSEAKIVHLNTEISVAGLWHEATAVLSGVFATPPSEPPPLLAGSIQSLTNALRQTPA